MTESSSQRVQAVLENKGAQTRCSKYANSSMGQTSLKAPAGLNDLQKIWTNHCCHPSDVFLQGRLCLFQ